MKTLVARLKEGLSRVGKQENGRSTRRDDEQLLIAQGREQFQRLLDKGLSLPIATV